MKSEVYRLSDKEIVRKWGQKLKTWRIEANLSQTDLANKTGMSRSSISEIEKGRNFSVGSLIAILRVLEQLQHIDLFVKEETFELSPMEIYEREKKKRKRGGYHK